METISDRLSTAIRTDVTGVRYLRIPRATHPVYGFAVPGNPSDTIVETAYTGPGARSSGHSREWRHATTGRLLATGIIGDGKIITAIPQDEEVPQTCGERLAESLWDLGVAA